MELIGGRTGLLQALQLACSQNPEELKVGERQLDVWKSQRGFYFGLSAVFGDRTVEPVVRWMALTCIKNGVEQFWRPGAPSPIAVEEKAQVRATLLQCIEEPVAQVFTQLGVLIARIARMDCPEYWPELLPLLTEGVHSSSEHIRKCYLHTMKHVVKSMAGRRLLPHKILFQEMTTSLFVYLLKLWGSHLGEGVALLSRGEGQAASSNLEMAHVCLKILRQMVIYGIPKFHGIVESLQFLGTLLEQVPQLAQLRSQLVEDHIARATLEDNINLKMKIIIELHSRQPIGFGPFVQRSLDLIHSLVFSADNAGHLFEKLLIACLNLFRLILRCEDYNPPNFERMTESVLPPGIIEAHQAKLAFFKAAMCHHILEQLIGHYLLLTDEELAVWDENPEEFAKEQPGDNYCCSVRVCVETALMALVHDFQLTVAPSLLALVEKVQTMDANTDPKSLRIKEAVYNAVGLCAFQLYDELDYDNWYQSHLLKELCLHDPGYKVIRYRVVWLMGEWVTVKMSSSLRPSLYSVIVPLLAPNEHMAIRLVAKEVIRTCVDDLDFKVNEFAPFLADCTNNLFQLLHDAREVDSKMAVLNVMSLLMENVGVGIRPHVSSLLHALPSLWVESGEKNATLLRSVIVSTLTNITKGLGSSSPDLHQFTLPVILLATDTKTSEHIYLAEDGLVLWLATLQNCPAPSAALVQLLSNLPSILGVDFPNNNNDDHDGSMAMSGLMDIGSENLLLCFQILDAYAVLCSLKPEFFMESCGKLVCRASQYYLCDVKPSAVVTIVNLLSRVVQLYSAELVEPILPTILHKMLEEDSPATMTAFLTLVARVLIHYPMFFFAFLDRMCSQTQQPAAELFGLVMDTWSVNLDSIANLQCRKLTGLAIANLLPVADVCVTSRFNSLVNMCVDVLHDVMDTTEQNQQFDLLVSGQERDPSEACSAIDTEHDIREGKLAQYDPLRCISLHEHFTGKLDECMAVHGQAAYTALINKVDIVVREQLLEFVPLKAAGQLLNISLHDTHMASATLSFLN